MTTYIAIISGPGAALDPAATARTYRPVEDDDGVGLRATSTPPSSRAGIRRAPRSCACDKVAIVGLGGTGSYVLDLVAKTPVGEIHLFDGDDFLTHNAFRAPGAPRSRSCASGRSRSTTSREHLLEDARAGIVAHPYYVDEANVDELSEMDFVFLCHRRRAGTEAASSRSSAGVGHPVHRRRHGRCTRPTARSAASSG